MNKKGQVVEITAIILAIMSLVGTMWVFSSDNTIYVADKSSGNFYDYSKCQEVVFQLNTSDLIYFGSLNEAKSRYQAAEGCV